MFFVEYSTNTIFVRMKKLFFQKLVFLIWLGICTSASAQILNIDRTGSVDTTGKRFFAFIGLSASADKQKKDLVDVSSSGDFSYLLPDSFVVVFKVSTDLTTNGSDVIQNAGFFHLRWRDNDSRILYPEVFTQFQWNGVLGMEQRKLIGSNLRWRTLRSPNNSMFMGLGVMYEQERWNFNGVPDSEIYDSLPDIQAKKWRINHYIKWSWRISDKTDFVLANFTQIPVDKLNKPRIASNASVNFKFLKWLGFSVGYDSIYDLDPVVPISNYYYSLKGQLNLVF
jgi:hypothetical protein